MAGGKVATDFDAIIQADRERRKNQALAQQVFGKDRRASAPGSGVVNRKPGTGPSLASRIGVAKRSSLTSMRTGLPANGRKSNRPLGPASNGNVNAEWTHDLHDTTNQRGRVVAASRVGRMYNAINDGATAANDQFNIVSKPSIGMSIRGLAGPCAVQAQNFAPGTTAADIESAMIPIGGTVLKCTIVSQRPLIVAEIIFENREGAENVVETFNNQTADGRVLKLWIKQGVTKLPAIVTTVTAPTVRNKSARGVDLIRDRDSDRNDSYSTKDRSHERGLARDYDRDDEVMDGGYGFDDRMDADEQGNKGLYSDRLIGGNRNDRGRGRGRAESPKDRGQGGNRGYR